MAKQTHIPYARTVLLLSREFERMTPTDYNLGDPYAPSPTNDQNYNLGYSDGFLSGLYGYNTGNKPGGGNSNFNSGYGHGISDAVANGYNQDYWLTRGFETGLLDSITFANKWPIVRLITSYNPLNIQTSPPLDRENKFNTSITNYTYNGNTVPLTGTSLQNWQTGYEQGYAAINSGGWTLSYGICKPLVTGSGIPEAPSSTYYTSYNPPVTNTNITPGSVTNRTVVNIGRFYWIQRETDPIIVENDIFGTPEIIKNILYEFRNCAGDVTTLDARTYPVGTMLRPVGDIRVEGACSFVITSA